MTDRRARAAQIKAAGEAERGNFNPSGVPLSMYNYWLNTSDSSQAELIREGLRKENFCHFWRVVAIWAPMWFVGSVLVDFFSSLAGKVIAAVVVGVAVFSLITFTGSWMDVLVVGGVFVGIAAAAVGLAVAGENVHRRWPMVLPTAALTVLGAVALGLYVWALITALTTTLVVTAVVVLGGALALFVASRLSDYFAGQRALAKAERDAAWDKYFAGEGPDPSIRTVREPNKFEVFFSRLGEGIADFVILIAQIVRVKKWKICPFVELDAK